MLLPEWLIIALLIIELDCTCIKRAEQYAVISWIARLFVGNLDVSLTVQANTDEIVVVSSLHGGALVFAIVTDAVIGIFCYFGTRRLMKNYLNVE